MLIDEKGRLFGKINIIDLLIVIVIIAAAVVLGFKFVNPKSAEVSTATVKYYAEEVTDFVIDKINIGDNLMDEVKNVELGKVTNIEISDAVSYGVDDEGKFVKSSKPDHKSLIITSEVNAQKYPHGMIVNSSRYYVGHTFVLLAGKAKLYLRVYDIQFKE